MNSEQLMKTASEIRQFKEGGNDSTYRARRSAIATSRRWTRIAFFGLVLAAAIASAQQGQPAPQAVKFKTLVSFDGTDGGNPYSQLVQGVDGQLYGTTAVGGANGGGNFFKLLPDGSPQILYSFCAQPNCADGYGAQLVLGPDGNFYGANGGGGNTAGGGTVFRISPAGELKTLYQFCSLPDCADGTNPLGLTLGIDGNFYGATGGGGTNPECACGTIFKLTTTGEVTTVYNLGIGQGAPVQFAPVIQATDGNLYGVTQGPPWGSVYKVTLAGVYTTLYNFCSQSNCSDGKLPQAPLIQASDGALYGTTLQGGNVVGDDSFGIVFKITLDGAFTVLHKFCSQPNCADGDNPDSGLIQGSDGSFYGTTPRVQGRGTIFRLTPSGKLTTLYSFDETVYDVFENPPLMQRTDGTFYGPEVYGGTANAQCAAGTCGGLFSLSVGLGPFVQTLPISGKVGDTVQILGNELTNAESVSFNGVPASFQAESETLISATVPAGATSGFVTVKGANSSLKSTARFQVRQ